MSAPAGLVGASLALWGVANGAPWIGAGAGIAYEAIRAARVLPPERARALLVPVIRACALLVLAALAYVLATQALPHSLYNWLRWLPPLLLPLAAVAILAGGAAPSAFVRAARPSAPAPEDDRALDVSHAYAALVLAAAGTGSVALGWLYLGYVAIVGWALLPRMAGAQRAKGVAMVAAAAVLGYGLHLSIAALQGQVEEWSTELIADLIAPKADPFRERTRIGDLGKIKLSDRIVMRVAVDGPRPGELLLRESAFERYHAGEWQSARRVPRQAQRDGDRWTLSAGPGARRLDIRRTFPGGEGLLPLPLGARTLEGLPAQAVEIFPSGTARVRGTPRFASFVATYDERAEHDSPDAERDLAVPAVLREMLAKTLRTEDIAAPSHAETLERLRGWFATRFSYSLNLGDKGKQAGGRTIADFLLHDRKGHCEYFATATVLLLREAGIPARYVGGYSVQEYSTLEKAFIVRARHAHAWALAYVDGRWVHVDTTPARWADFEAEAAKSAFAPLLDRLSWLFDRLVLAWAALPAADAARWAGGVAGAALLALAAWFSVRRWRSRPRAAKQSSDPLSAAWRAIEERATLSGYPRGSAETPRAWAARLAAAGAPSGPQLVALAHAYYRTRFDPASPASDTLAFLAAARAWAARDRS